jgi:hypothetical protein
LVGLNHVKKMNNDGGRNRRGRGCGVRFSGYGPGELAAVDHTLAAGDIALIKEGEYTIADDAATPSQVIVRAGTKHIVGAADDHAADAAPMIAPRTYGVRQPGATTLLHGIYELHGSAGDQFGQP